MKNMIILKVLIPFLSGLFFQPVGLVNTTGSKRLNPLSIGSVFPTQRQKKGVTDCIRLNPLSIGSVFPTKLREKMR